MKYSIIIVAYKDYASLEKCIASVRSSGIKDYEIIVLDNSPTEMHPKHLLEDARQEYGLWLLSKDNVGFAAGCNMGARRATGEILIFLNPDTQVFGNWADDMAKGIQGDTVAVGPVSNFVAGFQQVERWGGEDKGFAETLLLIGFCLMIRADIFRDLGGMDEKLFLGCDDLDLSWRIQRAGYKMAIATGVFVHHEGHTSMNLNPEKDRLIKESSDAMRAKLLDFYGPDVPSSEELWGCKILATSLKRMRLSVCMIAPDDRKPEFPWADEVVCINVGTVDHFAEARNRALAKCTGDWVLWLDTDDFVSSESAALIDALIHKPGNNVALQACHFAFKVENTSKDGSVRDSFYQPRLFPRLPGIEWGGLGGCKGLVHETYFENCQKLGLPMVQANNIVIQHTGYSDPSLEAKKAGRNLALLLKEPDNAFKWYNVGCSYMVMGELEKASEGFKKALEVASADDPFFIDNIRYNLAMCLHKSGADPAEVLPHLEPNKKADAKWLLGMLKIEQGQTENDLDRLAEGCDDLWAYLKMGDIKDNMGTNCPIFRKAAVNTLTEIGVIKV